MALSKVILGFFALIGVVINAITLYFKPDYLVLESSKSFPQWMNWVGIFVTALSVGGFLALEIIQFCHQNRHRIIKI